MIEETGAFKPFLVFAEGGTTNGTSIAKFKKGAFVSEKRVKPMFLKYEPGSVSLAYDSIDFFSLMVLQLSWCCFRVSVNHMPEFQPNEYLFETHKDKGSDRWEIFAWALRDVMAKTGGFALCDTPFRVKFQYESFMQQQKGASIPVFPSEDTEAGPGLASPMANTEAGMGLASPMATN